MLDLDKKKEFIDFEEILKHLKVDEDQKRTEIFLNQSSLEISINCYNKHIQNMFEANIDLLFITEEYGLAFLRFCLI